jgi:hypothetical protein
MAAAADIDIDTSKLSEDNVKNYKREDTKSDGKKWVSCEIFIYSGL